MDFLDELQNRILPGDGAMGTELFKAGVPRNRCLEALCAEDPEPVCRIHENYIAAGARVIRTNSFGANAARLERSGLQHRVNEFNWSAAQLARQCARGRGVYVAGSVGPLGITAEQAAEQGVDREALFREQIGALLDGGVHLICLETFIDPDELALALHVKQSLHHCPALCSLACPAHGLMAGEITPSEAVEKLRKQDAELTGFNCVDSATILRLFERIPSLSCAYPSAGLPAVREGRLFYDLRPDDFARTAGKLAGLGARLIGGCCGTGPEHIAAMTEALSAA
jgi:homocysteine S-methyltransferase